MQIGDDIMPFLYQHLLAGREKAKKGVDFFVHSNGGSGTAPWRLVNLIREFSDKFTVLVPHHAYSAATLIALGADEIIMHKMGNLGPIDPSVTNIFNPPHPQAPGQLAPISVEDVSAYFKLVTEDVGITHQDELVQALVALTEKVHPLALGNVQRSHNQSRMLARKLMKKHMSAEEEHEIETIIENLKSNLYFHGHPINRREAKDDLKLKVVDPTDDVENKMWELYLEYERVMKLNEPFNALHELELFLQNAAAAAPQQNPQQIVQQLIAQLGITLPPQQLAALAAALAPSLAASVALQQQQQRKVKISGLPGAYLESVDLGHVFLSDLTVERVAINTPMGPQDATKIEPTWQRWEPET